MNDEKDEFPSSRWYKVAPELGHSHSPLPGSSLSLLRENHLCPSLLKKTLKQSQIFSKEEKQHFLCALQNGFLRTLKANILQEIAGKGNLEVNLHFCSFRKKSLKDKLSSCNN